jgi:hypothetical protein
MAELLKLVELLSVGAGPFVSYKIPGMPRDLQKWAMWLSGILSAVALIWTKVALKDPLDVALAKRYLLRSGIGAGVFAVIYTAIALWWRSETGGPRDMVLQTVVVLCYSLCFACATSLTTAGEKLAK